MTIRDTDQATRIAAMVELKRRESRKRERQYRGSWTDVNRAYERGRTDMAAEILREIEAGKY
jgi:hypothetical protein